MKKTYLDYAAATPTDPNVLECMNEVVSDFSNPSAQYSSALHAKKLLNQARKDIAMFLNANSDEVIFTSGATQSNNLALLGAARACKKGHIISIATEHASIREPLNQLKKEGFSISLCKVGIDGVVSKSELQKLLSKDTILVSISYANSEIGTIQPITKISKIIKEYNPNIIFHTDASAASPLLNCDVSRLGVDLLSLSSNKVYGPNGIGALYIKRKTNISPIEFGGGQENGMQPGTPAVNLAVGFAKALEIAQKNKKKDEQKLGSLLATFICILMDNGAIRTAGPNMNRDKLANLVCLYFDGINGEDIVAYMDSQGFEIATGAACEAAKEEPSKALLTIGLTKSQAQGSIRISIGRETTQKNIEDAAEALINTLNSLGYNWK